MDMWELVARERIRDTLALYNWSGDAFRLDEMMQAFCEDGVMEIRGEQPLEGQAAIVAWLSGGAAGNDEERRAARKAAVKATGPRIVRHTITNIRFVELTPEQARTGAYFTVFTDIGLDHYGRYRDTFVPVGDRWLIKHRFVSTDWRNDNSVMAAPDSVPDSAR
jgi:hypothetical protein